MRGEPLVGDVLDTLDEALWGERLTYGLDWGPEVFAGFEERVSSSNTPAVIVIDKDGVISDEPSGGGDAVTPSATASGTTWTAMETRT